MRLLSKYVNGNLVTELYDDGTRIRTTDDDEFKPSFAENVDIHISDRCDNNCKMCYANCTPTGNFGVLDGWNFLDTLHPGTEMALNLNFPIHPGFINFIKYLRSKDIIVNVTVNQNHFEMYEEVIRSLYNDNLIFGLGVSLTNPTKKFVNKIKRYPNAVIHVIAGLFSDEQYQILKDNDLKLLILGYKILGRGTTYISEKINLIDRNKIWLDNNLREIINHFNVVSFDNLALSQLSVRDLLTKEEWDEFYGGDDGTFTFFINLVDSYFAKNSLSEVHYPIENKSMDEMFNIIIENN